MDQMSSEEERVVAADRQKDLELCGQVGMRPSDIGMGNTSELNSVQDVTPNLLPPSTEVVGGREITSHTDAYGEQMKELDNDELPKQSIFDSSHEKTKSEDQTNETKVSDVTSSKAFSSVADNQLEEAAVEPHDNEAVNMNGSGFLCKRQVTPARCPLNEYSSVEEAVPAWDALHNTFWPHGNPKALKVDYSNEIESDTFCYCGAQSSSSTSTIDGDLNDLKVQLLPTTVKPVVFDPYNPVNLTHRPGTLDLSSKSLATMQSPANHRIVVPFLPILHGITYAAKHAQLLTDLVENYEYFESNLLDSS